MYHLRLNKALSYDGAVSATREHPDVYTDDEAIAVAAVASGYFDLIEIPAADNAEDPFDLASLVNDPLSEPDADDPDGYVDVTAEDTIPDYDTLASMTKAELLAFAEERDIDIPAKATKKGDILAAISVHYGGSYTMIDLQKE